MGEEEEEGRGEGEEEEGGRSEARDLDIRDVRRRVRVGGSEGAWLCLGAGGTGGSLGSEFDERAWPCVVMVTPATAREGRDLRWGDTRE